MKNSFLISHAKDYQDQTVTFSAWVSHKRSSGKIKFLILRDGTGWMQGVLVKGTCSEKSFELFESLTQESSLTITGKILQDQRGKNGYELSIEDLEIIHIAKPYPLSPKEHGIEFLLEKRHLWIRTQKQWAILRIRSKLMYAITTFFEERDFVRFDTPILTPSSCEGTSTLFATPYFDEKAYLSQSGQLYGEVGAFAFRKVYTFGPTFRAEKSKTRKHLTEFWMLEPEMAFCDLNEVMNISEEFILSIIHYALTHCKKELEILEKPLHELEQIKGPFVRKTYDEILEALNQNGMPLDWGEDFGAPHEKKISDIYHGPVFIYNMPVAIKSFYFKQDPTHKYALGCDLIAPDGYGEIIGGGQREENDEVLKNRILSQGLKQEEYEWYLDLRRFGSVPHAGFGLGFERLIAWITGAEHVRETIPFPRMIHILRP